MPTLTADKVIGKGLIAKRKVNRLNSSLQKIGEFQSGDAVGVVYSYVQRNGQLYWLFQPTYQNIYLVKHESDAFVLTDDLQTEIKKQQLEEERERREAEIQAKGVIPYYIEKYGKFLVLILAGTMVVNTIIKTKRQ